MQFDGIIGDLIAEKSLVLYIDLRSGSFRDWSGYGNHGVASNGHLSRGGFQANTVAGKIVVANSAELNLTEATLVCFMEPWNEKTGWGSPLNFTEIITKTNGTLDFLFYITPSNGNNRLYSTTSNSVFSTSLPDILGKQCFAASMKNGENPTLYLDGVYSKTGDAVFDIYNSSNDITLGNFVDARGCRNIVHAYAIVNRKLTSAEHFQLYSQLKSMG